MLAEGLPGVSRRKSVTTTIKGGDRQAQPPRDVDGDSCLVGECIEAIFLYSECFALVASKMRSRVHFLLERAFYPSKGDEVAA